MRYQNMGKWGVKRYSSQTSIFEKKTLFFPQQQNGYPKIGVKRLPLNPWNPSLRHRLNDDNRDCHAASKPPSPAWAPQEHTACCPACPACSSPATWRACSGKKWRNGETHHTFTPSLRLMGLLGVLPTMNFRCTKRPAVPYPTSHFCSLSSILFAWSSGHVSICNSIPFHTSTLLDGSSTYVSKRLWCHSLFVSLHPNFQIDHLPPLGLLYICTNLDLVTNRFKQILLTSQVGTSCGWCKKTSNSIGSSDHPIRRLCPCHRPPPSPQAWWSQSPRDEPQNLAMVKAWHMGVYGHLSHDGNHSKREITLFLIPIDDIDDHPARWVHESNFWPWHMCASPSRTVWWASCPKYGEIKQPALGHASNIRMSPPNDERNVSKNGGECGPNSQSFKENMLTNPGFG